MKYQQEAYVLVGPEALLEYLKDKKEGELPSRADIENFWKILAVEGSCEVEQMKAWKEEIEGKEIDVETIEDIDDEIWQMVLKKSKWWKAPGRDLIQGFWWKNFPVANMKLKSLFCEMLVNGQEMPQSLVEYHLYPKQRSFLRILVNIDLLRALARYINCSLRS